MANLRDEPIRRFRDALIALQRALDQFDVQGVIIGGVAVTLVGQARYTADIDAVALLALDQIPSFLEVAAQVGLVPRIEDALIFARRSRVLLLKHVPSDVEVDVSLGILPFEIETVERSQLFQTGEFVIRLPTPEDLIILKAVAHRPKDLLDIRTLIETHPHLDVPRIRRWVKEFGKALDRPELWKDIAPWFMNKV